MSNISLHGYTILGYPFISGHLHCFYLLAIVNIAPTILESEEINQKWVKWKSDILRVWNNHPPPTGFKPNSTDIPSQIITTALLMVSWLAECILEEDGKGLSYPSLQCQVSGSRGM